MTLTIPIWLLYILYGIGAVVLVGLIFAIAAFAFVGWVFAKTYRPPNW